LDCDRLNDSPDSPACAPRTDPSRQEGEKILDILPAMNYGRQGDEIRQMHADLNRVRKLQQKIKE
jgi:hypothetical protein